MIHRVFVDANVLASKTLSDWLFMIRNESADMYHLVSSHDVLVEAARALLKRYPRMPGAVAARRFEFIHDQLDDMNSDFDAEIDFDGSDEGDFHVHASAISTRADILLTNNLQHFPPSENVLYEPMSADDFFCLADDSNQEAVREVTRKQLTYWDERRRRSHLRQISLVDALCKQKQLVLV